MNAALGFVVAYLFRWLPHATPTGLYAVGHPDDRSRVIVTGNFSLTVKRVKRALEGLDVWLLVVNTQGINVWCAADGGILTEHRVIDAVKTSQLASKVSHHELILPALSAPGVDRGVLREKTGFRARFGPVYARDIPTYLEAGRRKTDSMRRFDFGLRHRVDMFLALNFPVYLLVAVVLGVVARRQLLGFTIMFWAAVATLYSFIDVIPGKTGWGQAMSVSATVVLGWVALDWVKLGQPLAHWGWLLATVAVFFAAGFDLAGTVSARKSDAEIMMHRLGFSRFGSLFVEKNLGEVRLDRDRCGGCRTCSDVCPIGVFAVPDAEGKMTFRDVNACFSCGACVKQCPEGALTLV